MMRSSHLPALCPPFPYHLPENRQDSGVGVLHFEAIGEVLEDFVRRGGFTKPERAENVHLALGGVIVGTATSLAHVPNLVADVTTASFCQHEPTPIGKPPERKGVGRNRPITNH
jgi:hypothetical protein